MRIGKYCAAAKDILSSPYLPIQMPLVALGKFGAPSVRLHRRSFDYVRGITLLGVLTKGIAGLTPGELVLDDTQWAWAAGHAHAGVWVILSLVMQMLIDSTRLSTSLMWLARILGS